MSCVCFYSYVVFFPLSNYILKCFSESAEKLASMLTKMCLESTVVNSGAEIEVEVPPTRHDVLHACDIIEDVAIAYGYNNIKMTFPTVNTVANEVSKHIRKRI